MRSEIMDGILRHIHPIGGIENARLLEISPGHAKLSMEITQEALNLYGNVHGGCHTFQNQINTPYKLKQRIFDSETCCRLNQ